MYRNSRDFSHETNTERVLNSRPALGSVVVTIIYENNTFPVALKGTDT